MTNTSLEKRILLNSFRHLLNENKFNAQWQLVNALSEQGFRNITQTKVSRLINKVGAIKIRRHNATSFYQIPIDQIPAVKQSVSSVVTSINHNRVQILLKTIKAGAPLIAELIDAASDSLDILGCIASDSSILVIPSDTGKINEVMLSLQKYLNMND